MLSTFSLLPQVLRKPKEFLVALLQKFIELLSKSSHVSVSCTFKFIFYLFSDVIHLSFFVFRTIIVFGVNLSDHLYMYLV